LPRGWQMTREPSRAQFHHTMPAMGRHHQTSIQRFLIGSHQSLSSLGFGMCSWRQFTHVACALNANWPVGASNRNPTYKGSGVSVDALS
jgi:hypothetical protein